MRRLLLSAAVVLTLAGCETAFEAELPAYEAELSLNGLFAADTLFAVEVRRSFAALEPDSEEGIGDATLTLYEDGERVGRLELYAPEQASNFTPYRYHLPGFQATPGRRYTLEAEAPGFPAATATDVLPERVPFTLDVDTLEATPDDVRLAVTLRFTDPADVPNFYALSLAWVEVHPPWPNGPNSARYVARPVPFESANALLLDGRYDPVLIGEGLPSFDLAYFADAAVDGTEQAIRIEVRTSTYVRDEPETLQLSFYAISEAYYRYLRSREPYVGWDYDLPDNPFAEPVRLHSNVEGGLGIFAGAAITRKAVVGG